MENSTTYSLNCSLPPAGVNFVAGPSVRGTLDIAWACLGVIVLSTWDAMPGDIGIRPRAKGRWAKLWQSIKDLLRGLRDMVYVMLGPELATARVLSAYFDARYAFRQYKATYALDDMVDWSMPKAYLVATKLFGIQFDETKYTDRTRGNSDSRSFDETSRDTKQADLETLQPPRKLLLKGNQLGYLRKIGVIDSFPTITDEEIADRNKANGLVQFLTLLQIGWLVVQVIARYTHGLAATQLEIATLAFALLRFATLVLDWNRPKGMKLPIFLYATRALTDEESRALDNAIYTDADDRGDMLTFACLSIVGSLFGGLHCLAWNEEFPTSAERILWRVASVLTTCLPLLPVIVMNRDIADRWLLPPIGIYIVSRAVIIAETIRTLFYQPPSAFAATNIVGLPHLG